MLHIAAGVFLGLIAYTVTMGWWAGRHERREKRRLAREARRLRPYSPPGFRSCIGRFVLAAFAVAAVVVLEMHMYHG